MNLLSRIIKSVQDGSFAFKLLNCISPVEYVPSPENEINQYLAKHYPNGEAWRTLSSSSKKTWIQFHTIFNRHKINNIAYVGANEGNTALALNEVFPGCEFFLMDVQGYENEVLLGAKESLKSCKVIISELSLQALYSGSSTFDSVYQTLVHQGFQLQYLINPMQGESHQILQIDGIFVRV